MYILPKLILGIDIGTEGPILGLRKGGELITYKPYIQSVRAKTVQMNSTKVQNPRCYGGAHSA